MNASKKPHGTILSFPSTNAEPTTSHNVLAVVGGVLDEAVVDLALVLAREAKILVDLLQLVDVPMTLPMRAYGEYWGAHGGDAPLHAAEQICGPSLGEAGILLTRGMGPALVAETLARESSGLVIGTPDGGWWVRWRGRRAIAHVQAQAECRVYVVHAPLPPHERELPRTAAR
jgi:hypothetical protein